MCIVSTRQLPWHGPSVKVDEAFTAEEAIRLAKLDWEVELRPMYLGDGTEIPDKKALCREDELYQSTVLGIVSPLYHPVQNVEAFDFMDGLIGEEIRYEVAGDLQGGKRVFMSAKMERDWNIGGDDVNLYLLFSNDHTGHRALRVAVTPVRVVCQNTLQLALKQARHTWMFRHCVTIRERLAQAREALHLAGGYMAAWQAEAERMLNVKISMNDVNKVLDDVLKRPEFAVSTSRESKLFDFRLEKMKQCLNAEDLANFHDASGWKLWGLVNAMSDYETHSRVRSASNVLGKVLNGTMPLTERTRELATILAI